MVKINEFHDSEQDDNKLNFSIVHDLHTHMKNDPMFYRKDYFPTVAKMADYYRENSSYDPTPLLQPMITRGINSYCKKYKLANMPDDIFHEDHRQRLLNKVREEEIKQIEKGDYK